MDKTEAIERFSERFYDTIDKRLMSDPTMTQAEYDALSARHRAQVQRWYDGVEVCPLPYS